MALPRDTLNFSGGDPLFRHECQRESPSFKVGASLIILALVLWFALSQAINGHYLAALAWLFAGLATTSWVLGISELFDYPFVGLAGCATLFSVMSVFIENDLARPDRQIAQLDLFGFYLKVEGGLYGPVSYEARQIINQGIILCGTQHHVDMAALAGELQKAFHLGPGTSLTLESYDQFLAKKDERLSCLGSFVAFTHHAPDIAKAYLKSHPATAALTTRQ